MKRTSLPITHRTIGELIEPVAVKLSGHKSCIQKNIGAPVSFFIRIAGMPTETGES